MSRHFNTADNLVDPTNMAELETSLNGRFIISNDDLVVDCWASAWDPQYTERAASSVANSGPNPNWVEPGYLVSDHVLWPCTSAGIYWAQLTIVQKWSAAKSAIWLGGLATLFSAVETAFVIGIKVGERSR